MIEYTKAMVSHLHGLVRMSAEIIGKIIAASDTRFTEKNRIITKRTGDDGVREEKVKMLLKPINVAGWIEFMKKMWIITGKIEFKGKKGRSNRRMGIQRSRTDVSILRGKTYIIEIIIIYNYERQDK